jgi:hypothetical protein
MSYMIFQWFLLIIFGAYLAHSLHAFIAYKDDAVAPSVWCFLREAAARSQHNMNAKISI